MYYSCTGIIYGQLLLKLLKLFQTAEESYHLCNSSGAGKKRQGKALHKTPPRERRDKGRGNVTISLLL